MANRRTVPKNPAPDADIMVRNLFATEQSTGQSTEARARETLEAVIHLLLLLDREQKLRVLKTVVVFLGMERDFS